MKERAMKVRIGIGLGTQGQRDDSTFGALVDDLERLGFDSLWLSERLTSPVPDPLLALAFAAGRTRRLKLGTSVLVLPGRNPALLAKELASLDRLSGGRLLPAFGLGASDPAEHQAFGVTGRERGPWVEEALPLLRRLWSEDAVDHDGTRFRYQGLTVRPRPLQQPLDLWLGGGLAPPALRRVGRLADGWLPSLCTPEEAAAGRTSIEETAADAGRRVDPEHFGAIVVYARAAVPDALARTLAARRPDRDPAALVPVGWAALRATLERFVAAGFSKFVLRPAAEPDSWTSELEDLAAQVLPLQQVRA
jgi:probable F420-dependent oxidoreductase